MFVAGKTARELIGHGFNFEKTMRACEAGVGGDQYLPSTVCAKQRCAGQCIS